MLADLKESNGVGNAAFNHPLIRQKLINTHYWIWTIEKEDLMEDMIELMRIAPELLDALFPYFVSLCPLLVFQKPEKKAI